MLAPITRLFRKDPAIEQAHQLYLTLVEQARQPFFYQQWHAPDSVDGRFDLIVLHLFMVERRLRLSGDEGAQSSAVHLIEVFIRDMDRSLREMGVGDLSVGKKVKKMADALNGRLQHYAQAIEADDDAALADVLTRNVYRSEKGEVDSGAVQSLAGYVRASVSRLDEQAVDALLAADVRWADCSA